MVALFEVNHASMEGIHDVFTTFRQKLEESTPCLRVHVLLKLLFSDDAEASTLFVGVIQLLEIASDVHAWEGQAIRLPDIDLVILIAAGLRNCLVHGHVWA